MANENKNKPNLLFGSSCFILGVLVTALINGFVVPHIQEYLRAPKVEMHVFEIKPANIINSALPEERKKQLAPFINILESVSGLKINFKNNGKTSAKNISFNLLFENCELKSKSVWSSNADCKVIIEPSKNLKMFYKKGVYIDVPPENVDVKNRGLYIKIPELRKNSEVEIKFSTIGRNHNYRFSKILCDNANVNGGDNGVRH